MTILRSRSITALLGATLLAVALPSAASAAPRDCPAKRGTLAKTSLGRVWHKGASLYACTTVYAHAPRARRMGPWKPGTKVAFDGVELVWSVPLVRDGVRSDRMWAGDADDGSRWLRGTRIVPASGTTPAREARVRTLRQTDRGAAWLTTAGDVVFALASPEDTPTPIGTLPGPLAPTDKLVLVGSYEPATADLIGMTLALVELDGDGDECGGSNPYKLTFQTDASAPLSGAVWQGGWSSTNCR